MADHAHHGVGEQVGVGVADATAYALTVSRGAPVSSRPKSHDDHVVMARDRLRALRFPNDQVDDISQLVYLHLRFHGYSDDVWSDSAVRRYVRDAGPLLDDLNELTRCDCTTRNERKARLLADRMDALEARIAELREREELEAIRPDLDGQAVMAHLGIPPGPDVGAALAMLLEARLDMGPLDEQEAYRRLDDWWAARQR